MSNHPDGVYILAVLGVVFAVTYALRAAPFVLLRKVRDHPVLEYLGKALPGGVMAILAVYTVADIDVSITRDWAAALAGVLATLGIHAWRGHAILSLFTGVAVYGVVYTYFG